MLVKRSQAASCQAVYFATTTAVGHVPTRRANGKEAEVGESLL